MYRDSAASLQSQLAQLQQQHEAMVARLQRQHATKLKDARSRISDLEDIAVLGEERLMAEQQKTQVWAAMGLVRNA